MNRELFIEPNEKGKAYLVVIGIDTYQDKAISKLENARKDAEDVLTLLTTEFQFESKQEFVLLDEAASLENITALFEKLTKHPNKFLAPDDSLIIYLAGHGTMKNNRGYFLPADAQYGKTHSYFPHSELREYLKEIPALHTFLVMDSCFSGAIFRNLEEWDAFSAGKEKLPSCIVFASGLLEKVKDGFRKGNSPFAAAFLSYLRHETQHKTQIPIGDLIRFVEKEVRNQGHTQQPYADRMPQSQDKKGELVLHRKAKLSPAQAAENRLKSLYELQDVMQLTIFIKENKGVLRQTAITYLEQIEAQTAFAQLKEKPTKSLCNAFLQKYEDNPAAYFTSLVAQVEQILEELLEMPPAFVPKLEPKISLPQVSTLPPILQQLEANMVFIKGGSFMMGSEEGYEDEKPVHKVNLSDFYMCKYQVTQKEWEFVMGKNPCYFKGEDLPVESVSWHDVREFIQKLNALMKQHRHKDTYSLPSEAQWEYAAKYEGSDNVDEVAWHWENSGKTTHPVGQKKLNRYGLYDMSGNVWEWCQDYYDADFYKNNKNANNPINEIKKEYMICRGGSWSSDADVCRTTFRGWHGPGILDNNLGFRLLREAQ